MRTWPIWWCLKPEAQVLLYQYQWDNYGLHLDILPVPDDVQIGTNIEPLEELSKIMKFRPRYSKGSYRDKNEK